MTQKQVETGLMNMRQSGWVGNSFLANDADGNPDHSWIFNFCAGKLSEVTRLFPVNFERMADFVDLAIRDHGQRAFVSAMSSMGSGGAVRPINLYWKIDESNWLRLMALSRSYSVIYQRKNTCGKVPT